MNGVLYCAVQHNICECFGLAILTFDRSGCCVWDFGVTIMTGGLVYRVGIGSTLVRAITAFDRSGRSRRVLLRDSYLGVN